MNVVTVSQINEYIKRKFDSDYLLKSVAVSGEISNYVSHSSGHSYFSLKDKGGVLKAVMFKGNKAGLKFTPENGMKVVAMGSLSSYPRDGIYQLYVSKLVSDGMGDLFIAFEELKKRLGEEGLFDESLKKPLPEFPEKVGVITSETGAVLHDIKNVLSRRYPLAEIILYPAKVQGEGAAATVTDALFRLNEDGVCDVAIIARGGGSMEDLWEFNSEKLARAVRASNIPVISAVGHETDFTICDFASDLRAPTPSAAAELCAPSLDDIRMRLDSAESLLNARINSLIADKRRNMNLLEQRLRTGSAAFISKSRLTLEKYKDRLRSGINKQLFDKKTELLKAAGKVEHTNPLAILSKGYGMVLADDKAVLSAASLNVKDTVKVRMADGDFSASITEVNVYEI